MLWLMAKLTHLLSTSSKRASDRVELLTLASDRWRVNFRRFGDGPHAISACISSASSNTQRSGCRRFLWRCLASRWSATL